MIRSPFLRRLPCLRSLCSLKRSPWPVLCAVLAAAFSLHHRSAGEDVETVRLRVRPAAEPRPALKYRLLPGLLERQPGNAAVDYGKVSPARSAVFKNQDVWDEWERLMHVPLHELRQDKLRNKWLHADIFRELDQAARRQDCDWQLPLGEQPFYSMLLGDVQQTRSFARLLQIRARFQIAYGEFDDALHTLRTGYALGRHVSRGQTLIHAFIGMAICDMMSEQLLELIQQPRSPNLYWALTMLPHPLIDIRPAVEGEMSAVYLTFPETRQWEDQTRSPGFWRESLLRFWQQFVHYSSDSFGMAKLAERPEVLTLACLRGYPLAKRALIATGLDAEEVEQMPVAQVIAQYTLLTYRELSDDVFKWFYTPYWESREYWANAERALAESARQWREVIPVAANLMPAMWSAKQASVRIERKIALLRMIEALRLHGAAHLGKLPQKLSELAEVPVPVDPATNETFLYRLRGDTAILEETPLRGLRRRYEISFDSVEVERSESQSQADAESP